MFTGIIETIGEVLAITPQDRGARLALDAPALAGTLNVGDSLAVSGVCLTAVEINGGCLEFDAVEETLSRSTLGHLRPGDRVNLERPLTLGARLGGHLVQGHVDAVGTIESVEARGAEKWLSIVTPAGISRYIVEKGSITVDGISLTVAAVEGDRFAVAIIPHTAEVTTLGTCRPGARVNLEVDMIAKYLEKLAAPYSIPLGAAARSV